MTRIGASLAFAVALLASIVAPGPVAAAELPAGFTDTEVLDGLELPTAVRFSPDGRVFVAEKSGLIQVFDGLADNQPTVFADLRLQVNDYFDRGLLGLALDPGFPIEPYVYVLYTHDAEIGGIAPRWGSGKGGDDCPSPPGGFVDGCVVSGRLSRLTAGPASMVGSERILVEDWCQQFWGHSIGALAFDSTGALYASSGEGASAAVADYGQAGDPLNPCGDPPGGVGADLSPPASEGGSLRSQDIRTPSDPLGLSGSIIRVDPSTGDGLLDNPYGEAEDKNLRRIIAYGLRNPFRFALQPGTDELWVGDVGWSSWEEINRFQPPRLGQLPPNGGWPCYEGPGPQAVFAGLGLNLCIDLYGMPEQVTAPVFSYPSGKPVTQGERCLLDQGSSISAIAFYVEGGFPNKYEGALFFGDYARRCIWVIEAGENGDPDPSLISVFEQDAGSAVDLQAGPGGDLFYADIAAGEIRRISFSSGNLPPTAVLVAEPSEGSVPLDVQLDAGNSSDPEGAELEFTWDLDEDGEFDDALGPHSAITFEEIGDRMVSVRVADGELHDTASTTIHAGNTRPTATILAPLAEMRWRAGESIELIGAGTDAEDGPLAGPALIWSVILDHCSSACHEHFVSKTSGANGQIVGPSHEFPASLRLRLTARDSGGLQGSDEIEIDPSTARIDLRSEPPGVRLGLGAVSAAAPFSRQVIRGSRVQASAPSSVQLGSSFATFLSWDDGSFTHPVPVYSFEAEEDKTLTAVYAHPQPDDIEANLTLACVDPMPPRSSLRPGGVEVHRSWLQLHGRAGDERSCPSVVGISRVFVYVATHRGARCRFLRSNGRLSRLRDCQRRILLSAHGFASFDYAAKVALPPGRYLAGSLAIDAAGNQEPITPGNTTDFQLKRR
ncbi:MAG TPA: PQQ-dependent sugar dehydrogenase [Solirubrobacterales bacterium]|nr:PQQ-dependent sugar dehydrogenase [Solirubrobacterales bacterium]